MVGIRFHAALAAALIPALSAQVVLLEVKGTTAEHLGVSLARVGDVDADGCPDLAVGGWDVAKVISGRTGGILYTVRNLGNHSVDNYVVAGGADFNRDGHGDFVVGCSLVQDPLVPRISGLVRIYSGKDGAILRSIYGFFEQSRFGGSICIPGDVDGDGYADLAIGAYSGPLNSSYGYILVLSGQDWRTLGFLTSPYNGYNLGFSLAAAGDVDGDGVPDLVDGGSKNLRVYSGRDWRILHDLPIGDSWVRVAGGEDFNLDGHADPIAAFEGYFVKVFSGKSGALIKEFRNSSRKGFGADAAALPDLDGDGVPELAIGILGSNANTSPKDQTGRLEVYSGKNWRLLCALDGLAAGGEFARCVESAGDLNGDGYGDLLVGAPYEGRAILLSGDLRALSVDRTRLSLGQGGSQGLYLRAGPAHAGKIHFLFGSMTGTSPGTAVEGLRLPLNWDAYFALTALVPNTFLVNSVGTLDPAGQAKVVFTLPAATPPELAGTTLHHAYLVLNLVPQRLDLASNPVALNLEK